MKKIAASRLDVVAQLYAYGTSEGAKKGWDSRGRGKKSLKIPDKVREHFPNLGGEIPEASEPIPQEGHHAAVRTNDGQLFVGREYGETHVMLIKRLRIPADKVDSGGWLHDGVYEGTERSDAGRYAARARAVLSTLHHRQKELAAGGT